jgi:hypothetical protein
MDWKDLAKTIAAGAPMLGTLVAGPAGGAVGSLIASVLGVGATPDEVSAALAASPDAAVKIKELEVSRQAMLQQLLVQAEANRLQTEAAELASVNSTMQAEAKAEHWPTYTWRPFIGFVFGVMMLGVYFVLPLMHLQVPAIPTEAWLAMGAVLGAASWHRGRAQLEQVRVGADGVSEKG